MVIKRIVIGMAVLAAVVLASQATSSGTITYVTADRVYTDLGSAAGQSIGDTLKVMRRDEELGILVIESLARNSSVCIPLNSITVFRLGDQVYGTLAPSTATLPDRAEEVTVEPPAPERAGLSFAQSGTLSLRGHVSGYSANSSTGRIQGTFQYGAGLVDPWELKIWAYGRIDDKGDLDLYTLRADYGKPDDSFALQAGRIYPAKLVGIGATDGFLGRYRFGRQHELGALGGFQPRPGTLEFDANLKKIGAYYTRPFSIKEGIRGDGLLALVGQYAGGSIDREFVYLRLGSRYMNLLNFQLYHTLDIYRNGGVYQRSQLQPISTQFSLNVTPVEMLRVSVRYTARRQVLYQNSTTLVPDSLFEDELRSGLYSAIQLRADGLGMLRFSANLRGQSTSNENSVYLAGDYAAPAEFLGPADLDLRVAWLQNLVITGLRSRVRYGRPLNTSIRSWAEYELYLYGYGNRMDQYNRHSVLAGFSWRILPDLHMTASTELVLEADFQEFYAFMGASYRF